MTLGWDDTKELLKLRRSEWPTIIRNKCFISYESLSFPPNKINPFPLAPPSTFNHRADAAEKCAGAVRRAGGIERRPGVQLECRPVARISSLAALHAFAAEEAAAI